MRYTVGVKEVTLVSDAYREGERVWLKPFEDQPREKATILGYEKYEGMLIVEVERENRWDDGIREISADQIEGPA